MRRGGTAQFGSFLDYFSQSLPCSPSLGCQEGQVRISPPQAHPQVSARVGQGKERIPSGRAHIAWVRFFSRLQRVRTAKETCQWSIAPLPRAANRSCRQPRDMKIKREECIAVRCIGSSTRWSLATHTVIICRHSPSPNDPGKGRAWKSPAFEPGRRGARPPPSSSRSLSGRLVEGGYAGYGARVLSRGAAR